MFAATLMIADFNLVDSDKQLKNWRSHEDVMTCKLMASTNMCIEGNTSGGYVSEIEKRTDLPIYLTRFPKIYAHMVIPININLPPICA